MQAHHSWSSVRWGGMALGGRRAGRCLQGPGAGRELRTCPVSQAGAKAAGPGGPGQKAPGPCGVGLGRRGRNAGGERSQVLAEGPGS